MRPQQEQALQDAAVRLGERLRAQTPWQIMVRFKTGATGIYSSDYCSGTPEELITRLQAQAAAATEEDLAAIGATRDELTVAGWRYVDSWHPVRAFVDAYRMPGSPSGAQVVARLQERTR